MRIAQVPEVKRLAWASRWRKEDTFVDFTAEPVVKSGEADSAGCYHFKHPSRDVSRALEKRIIKLREKVIG
jgi:hypothetical protein